MKKITLIFIAIIVLISFLPANAYAYLVPLIGGAWWLITIIIAGIIAISAFIWAHIVKFKQMFKKDKNKTDTENVRKTN